MNQHKSVLWKDAAFLVSVYFEPLEASPMCGLVNSMRFVFFKKYPCLATSDLGSSLFGFVRLKTIPKPLIYQKHGPTNYFGTFRPYRALGPSVRSVRSLIDHGFMLIIDGSMIEGPCMALQGLGDQVWDNFFASAFNR